MYEYIYCKQYKSVIFILSESLLFFRYKIETSKICAVKIKRLYHTDSKCLKMNVANYKQIQ